MLLPLLVASTLACASPVVPLEEVEPLHTEVIEGITYSLLPSDDPWLNIAATYHANGMEWPEAIQLADLYFGGGEASSFTNCYYYFVTIHWCDSECNHFNEVIRMQDGCVEQALGTMCVAPTCPNGESPFLAATTDSDSCGLNVPANKAVKVVIDGPHPSSNCDNPCNCFATGTFTCNWTCLPSVAGRPRECYQTGCD